MSDQAIVPQKPQALVLSGPGFFNPTQTKEHLVALGFDVVEQDLGHLGDSSLIDYQRLSFVLLRGPVGHLPEEKLLIRLYSDRLRVLLKPALQNFYGPTSCLIVGMGRGANLLLDLPELQENRLDGINWKKIPDTNLPWPLVTDLGTQRQFHALAMSTLIPLISLQQFQRWLQMGTTGVGWRKGNLLITPFDLLALNHKEQLPQYGYEDLSSVMTSFDVLKEILQARKDD